MPFSTILTPENALTTSLVVQGTSLAVPTPVLVTSVTVAYATLGTNIGSALQGPPGLTTYDLPFLAAGPIQGGRAVTLDAFDQVAAPDLDLAVDGLRLLGVALNSASAQGEQVSIRRRGTVVDSGWAWDEGPVYVGVGGALTQTLPASGWVCLIGTAVNPTTVEISPQPIIL